jgi:hypothetical protein
VPVIQLQRLANEVTFRATGDGPGGSCHDKYDFVASCWTDSTDSLKMITRPVYGRLHYPPIFALAIGMVFTSQA